MARNLKILVLTSLGITNGDVVGGYAAIFEGLCYSLTEMGHEVKVLSFTYERQPHNLPFSLIPFYANSHIGIQVGDIVNGWRPDAFLVGVDLPHHADIYGIASDLNVKYIGMYPVEGSPVPRRWADAAALFHSNLVLSQFGVDAMEAAGVTAKLLPVPQTRGMIRAEQPEHIAYLAKLRHNVGAEGKYVVVKVADNHARKNWAETIEYFSQWDCPNALFMAVTRPENPLGWYFPELLQEFGATRKGKTNSYLWPDGKEFRVLSDIKRNDLAWVMNMATDLHAPGGVVLMDTGAEGLGMPILEAFAVGAPVVGAAHTSVGELLADNRGFLMKPGYEYRDVFGNVRRYMTDRDSWLETMTRARDNKADRVRVVNNARAWIKQRTWNKAAEILVKELR